MFICNAMLFNEMIRNSMQTNEMKYQLQSVKSYYSYHANKSYSMFMQSNLLKFTIVNTIPMNSLLF